jgi:hypothetical protein
VPCIRVLWENIFVLRTQNNFDVSCLIGISCLVLAFELSIYSMFFIIDIEMHCNTSFP